MNCFILILFSKRKSQMPDRPASLPARPGYGPGRHPRVPACGRPRLGSRPGHQPNRPASGSAQGRVSGRLDREPTVAERGRRRPRFGDAAVRGRGGAWACMCVHGCGTARVCKGREGRSSSGCSAWLGHGCGDRRRRNGGAQRRRAQSKGRDRRMSVRTRSSPR